MPKHPPIGNDNVKIVPYSAVAKYHLFIALLSNEKFGKPSASLGLRQAVRELSKLPEFADLWTEAQRLAATGESLPKMPSKGAAIFALHEVHVFLLLLPWREVEEMDGSLGLQMVILRIAEHEPYKRVWNQIRKGKDPNVDVPKRIAVKDVSGGRPVDYSCSAQMHDFLNWLGEGNRPQGVRRAIYALAKKDPVIDEYLREAEVIGEKTRQIIENLADDQAAQDAFSERTGVDFMGKKQNERKIIEWGIFDAVGLERELDRL